MIPKLIRKNIAGVAGRAEKLKRTEGELVFPEIKV